MPFVDLSNPVQPQAPVQNQQPMDPAMNQQPIQPINNDLPPLNFESNNVASAATPVTPINDFPTSSVFPPQSNTNQNDIFQPVSVAEPVNIESAQPLPENDIQSQLPEPLNKVEPIINAEQSTVGTVKETEGQEEHQLLDKAPKIPQLNDNGVVEIKGPPLPNQVNNNLNSSQSTISGSNNSTIIDNSLNSLPEIAAEPLLNEQNQSQQQILPEPAIDLDEVVKSVSKLPPLDSILGKSQTSQTPKSNNTNSPINNSTINTSTPTEKSDKPKQLNAARILANFNASSATMEDFMSYTIANKASDLHVSADNNVYIRVDGTLKPIQGERLSNDRVKDLIGQILTPKQMKELDENRELDLSYTHSSGDRFRINAFFKDGMYSSALRLIPRKIKSIAELGLPEIVYNFIKYPHGLVIVTGPTGSGKSTTLSSLINEINLTQQQHIITIEDPIEYIYPQGKSLIEQREVGKDTLSWNNALKSALRQAPDVVLVGEMRDFQTIEATITVAETGHLVFATLHTNSAAQTIDRIIDVFPEGQQSQVRAQLSTVLSAVIAQRLVPVRGGGRRAVLEILIATTAVKNAIRENKTYQIDNMIQTGTEVGMQTLESDLIKLIRAGEITVEEAQDFTVKFDELMSMLKGNK